jgi:hypothetical protein
VIHESPAGPETVTVYDSTVCGDEKSGMNIRNNSKRKENDMKIRDVIDVDLQKAVCMWMALFIMCGSVLLAQPRLTIVEGRDIDLGDVREGIVTKRTLTLGNDGSDTLRILDVTTSCGCTTVKPVRKILAPGETTLLPVTINSRGFRGRVRREVRIATNDPREPLTTVMYHSVIRTDIEYVPSYINFAETAVGARISRSVVLHNRTNAPIRLKSVKAPDKEISGSFQASLIEPRDSVTVVVTLRPVKRGELKGRLTIATDSKGSEQLMISYIAKVH